MGLPRARAWLVIPSAAFVVLGAPSACGGIISATGGDGGRKDGDPSTVESSLDAGASRDAGPSVGEDGRVEDGGDSAGCDSGSFDGGPPVTLAASNGLAFDGIAINGSGVYWTAQGLVLAVPMSGGMVSTVVDTPASGTYALPDLLAADSTNVYWVRGPGAGTMDIMATPVGGGSGRRSQPD